VPFYVVGPTSTIDLSIPTGDDIEIEMRSADEVTHLMGMQLTPDHTPAANPAFDITPAQLITAIITEQGIAHPPFASALARFVHDRGY